MIFNKNRSLKQQIEKILQNKKEDKEIIEILKEMSRRIDILEKLINIRK